MLFSWDLVSYVRLLRWSPGWKRRGSHTLLSSSPRVCSADKVSANTLTVVVPLWPHMQLNMTTQIPGCTNWQVKLTPITQERTDAQPCKISHVPYTPLGVCFKFQHFVFCKREPGRLLFWLIIILRGSDPFVLNMIYNIKQDPTLTKPKINIFFLYKHTYCPYNSN